MARISRFKKRVSDRSGFDYKEIELVRDGALLVGMDERDTPPPSKRPLGGERDVSGTPRANSTFTVSNINTDPYPFTVSYITAAGGITPSYVNKWMQVTGSTQNINISANPQIAAGTAGQPLTLQCVGSTITLDDGTGLSLFSAKSFLMTSGSIISFVYDTSGSGSWREVSRTP